MGKRLTDRALITEMVRFMGAVEASRLMGWLMVAALAGAERRSDLLGGSWGSRSTRWRVLQGVLRLREHLAEIGYDMEPEEIVREIVGSGRTAAT